MKDHYAYPNLGEIYWENGERELVRRASAGDLSVVPKLAECLQDRGLPQHEVVEALGVLLAKTKEDASATSSLEDDRPLNHSQFLDIATMKQEVGSWVS